MLYRWPDEEKKQQNGAKSETHQSGKTGDEKPAVGQGFETCICVCVQDMPSRAPNGRVADKYCAEVGHVDDQTGPAGGNAVEVCQAGSFVRRDLSTSCSRITAAVFRASLIYVWNSGACVQRDKQDISSQCVSYEVTIHRLDCLYKARQDAPTAICVEQTNKQTDIMQVLAGYDHDRGCARCFSSPSRRKTRPNKPSDKADGHKRATQHLIGRQAGA
ncbi:hypothetical protein BD289DRAFT_388 [Coniella lustricola]|uniref:Uncharacterized protein n=1 Tax=Coniella lustricola TaxID=2025994 RepID=A0A2T3AN90_9PEZI|nr:hypothetical protein BD289DRAFT_388 [Coniella lustricola]